ncbi:MAG: phage holin family protein [Nitrospiraceae bacterium]
MQSFLLRLLVTGIAVFLAIEIVPGIVVHSWEAGLAAVIVLAILNAVVRPLLYLVSLPIIVLTFGLFMVIINAILLKVAAALVQGFVVTGWWPAIGGAVVVSLVTTILGPWVGERHSIHIDTQEPPRKPPRVVN